MEQTSSAQPINGNGTVKNRTGTMRVDLLNFADRKDSPSKYGAIRDYARSDVLKILGSNSVYPENNFRRRFEVPIILFWRIHQDPILVKL